MFAELEHSDQMPILVAENLTAEEASEVIQAWTPPEDEYTRESHPDSDDFEPSRDPEQREHEHGAGCFPGGEKEFEHKASEASACPDCNHLRHVGVCPGYSNCGCEVR